VGPIALLARLVRRDLIRHAWQNVLLVTALSAAATSLVLGFALRGHTADAYAQTRNATAGPDVVAGVLPEPNTSVTTRQHRQLVALMHEPQVSRTSGPFPTTWTDLTFGNVRGAAEVQGRDLSPSAVDQPEIASGRWIAPGAAVIEQAFANAVRAHVGDTLLLGGRSFHVAGIAVTAAITPYPDVCFVGCTLATPTLATASPGLIWLTRADARALATSTEPVALTTYLTLRPGVDADAFVTTRSRGSSPSAPILTSWHDIDNHDGKLIRNERTIALLGGSLLSVLAVATVTVLIGTRLSAETRRIGTLKAIGATPAYVMTGLLVQTGLLAVTASVVGAALARVMAPLFDSPSAGLLGLAGATSVTPLAVLTALAVVVGVTALSTIIAALRPTRASTAAVLTALGRRTPRRRTAIAISSRLPTAGLIALRLIARRPRRSIITAAGIAVAATGTVAVLLANAHLSAEHAHLDGGLADPNAERLDHLMLALTVLLLTLAVLDVAFVATATALDAQTSLAVVQALGCTPAATLCSIATALAAPALLGTVVGLPAGVGLFAALQTSSGGASAPIAELLIVLLLLVCATAAIAALSARLSARRTIAQMLQSAGA
jgi:ABC-type lipoprotein release transport system permease subunit